MLVDILWNLLLRGVQTDYDYAPNHIESDLICLMLVNRLVIWNDDKTWWQFLRPSVVSFWHHVKSHIFANSPNYRGTFLSRYLIRFMILRMWYSKITIAITGSSSELLAKDLIGRPCDEKNQEVYEDGNVCFCTSYGITLHCMPPIENVMML